MRIASALLVMLLTVQARLAAQEGTVVRSIKFEGNQALTEDELRAVLLTYETGWSGEEIFGSEPYYFSRDVFQTDLENLVAEYQHEGYLWARIDTAIVRADDAGETSTIVIRISEGRAFTVDSVLVVAPGDTLWSAVFRQAWPSVAEESVVRNGVRFRDDDVTADQERITDTFTSRGYAYVKSEHSFDVDTSRARVSLLWTIIPGPLCRYGPITISGNERVETSLLQGKLRFAEGDVYSSEQLEDLQRDIYALGQFQAVLIRPSLGSGQEPRIPVRIAVQEASRTKAEFGVGYGAEEQFRAFVELKRLGFLGGARTLTLYAKHSSLTPIDVSLTFGQPDFLWPKLILYVRPYILFEEEIGYSVNRYGGDITLERRFFQIFLTSLTYSLEQVRTPDEQALAAEDPSTYNKSALGLSLTLNSATPVFDPERGWLNALRLFYTGLPPSPEVSFFHGLFDTRRYDRISDNTVLALRAKIGNIWPLTEDEFVPPEERFYAGGSYSVRGYSRNMLGPLDETGSPTGGLSLAEASVELRISLAGSLGIVSFLDAGNVWEQTLTYRLDEIAYAAGVGLRYDTPVGPVRFDAAKSLTDGGIPWQFHFSIGQAF